SFSRRQMATRETISSSSTRRIFVIVQSPVQSCIAFWIILSLSSALYGPPCLFRDRDLEPDPALVYPGLPDGQAGYFQDLADDKKAEPGIFAVSLFEDQFLLIRRDTRPVIAVAYKETPLWQNLGIDRDVPDRFTVPETVIDQVVKDPAEKGIGIDLGIGYGHLHRYRVPPDGRYRAPDALAEALPLGSLHPHALVVPGEEDLVLYRIDQVVDLQDEFLCLALSCHLSQHIDEAEKAGDIVQDIVAGQAVHQVEFLVCGRECGLEPFLIGNIDDDPAYPRIFVLPDDRRSVHDDRNLVALLRCEGKLEGRHVLTRENPREGFPDASPVGNVHEGKGIQPFRKVLVIIPGDVQRAQVEIGEPEVPVGLEDKLRDELGQLPEPQLALPERQLKAFLFCDIDDDPPD